MPRGLVDICPAVSYCESLKELSLTFDHDLPTEGIELLMRSLGSSRTLEIFKLFCADLQGESTRLLANAVLESTSLVDMRITSCNLTDITCLAEAIQQNNRLTRVDFSMNQISDTSALATLWSCPSITYLNVSQNEIGSESITMSSKKLIRKHFDRLASNTTLTHLHLDMNPMGPDFVEQLRISLQKNTTLTRLGFLSLTVSKEAADRIRYLISLNVAGRGKVQKGLPAELIPQILGRVSHEPDLIHGLITQAPHLWLY